MRVWGLGVRGEGKCWVVSGMRSRASEGDGLGPYNEDGYR